MRINKITDLIAIEFKLLPDFDLSFRLDEFLFSIHNITFIILLAFSGFVYFDLVNSNADLIKEYFAVSIYNQENQLKDFVSIYYTSSLRFLVWLPPIYFIYFLAKLAKKTSRADLFRHRYKNTFLGTALSILFTPFIIFLLYLGGYILGIKIFKIMGLNGAWGLIIIQIYICAKLMTYVICAATGYLTLFVPYNIIQKFSR